MKKAAANLWCCIMAGTLSLGYALPSTATGKAGTYSERFRPQYHFTPKKNWMNDPNGLVFYQGEYHLFYQYNPLGEQWGHMSWGHAVSSDLVHWKHLPVALTEGDGVMIFSGSVVVDWNNSSGFGQDGQPPFVAVYTGFRPSDNRQFQCIAFSNNRGRIWTKYAGNPVIDLHLTDFRDPKVQWYEPAKCWLMIVALSGQRQVRFYRSTNLKEWTALSDFGPAGSTGGVWECPDFFELPVAGSGHEGKWVLIVNVSSGAPAGQSGTQYFTGNFDGNHFTADKDSLPAPAFELVAAGHSDAAAPVPVARWLDYGSDLYATATWNDLPKSDHRRVLLGWVNHWPEALPDVGWRGSMSIPRELNLRQTAAGIRLVQEPARELKALRGQHYKFKGGNVTQANDWLKQKNIRGNNLELAAEFKPGVKGMAGLKVLQGSGQAVLIGCDRAAGRIVVDRANTGGFVPSASAQYAPLSVQADKVKLHIFVDACSIEVFVNDGEAVFTDLAFPQADNRGVEVFGEASNTEFTTLEVWKLSSIWK